MLRFIAYLVIVIGFAVAGWNIAEGWLPWHVWGIVKTVFCGLGAFVGYFVGANIAYLLRLSGVKVTNTPV